ncbi:hypothetical protein HMPREF3033_01088 [Veillonellaceae bacterium DNF00751]|nr:hypothetical protein HMPREF3033_01088 [Veillonellaceae bacterium DNF00751]
MGVYTIYYTPIWYTSMRYLRVLHKKTQRISSLRFSYGMILF